MRLVGGAAHAPTTSPASTRATPTGCSGRCSTTCSTRSRSRSATGTATSQANERVRRRGRGALPARRPDLGARLPAPAPAGRCCATGCPDARIGFFLHIPFPSEELFRTLSGRGRSSSQGMLGADLVGFHTPAYLRHFATALTDILGLTVDIDRVQLPGREVRLGVFPMGVDAQTFADARARSRRRGRGGGASAATGACGSWWASTGSTTPRASPAGCSPTSGCSRLTPSCGRRCGWSRWRCPRAPASRPTRTSARWWTGWWAASTAPSARRGGCRSTTSSAGSPPRSWSRSTGRRT